MIETPPEPDEGRHGVSADYLFDVSSYSNPRPKASHDEEPELPWLQPIWRDETGEYHYAEFGLIYRTFARTLIHEQIFWYVGQHDVPRDRSYLCGERWSYPFNERLEDLIRNGFPDPESGGKMEPSQTTTSGRKVYQVIIFCDDLFLCPTCGVYHPYRQSVPKFEWLTKARQIDHNAISRLIEERRCVAEFSMKPCGQKDCAGFRNRVLERMKEDEDTRTRVTALNELIRRQPQVAANFPINRSARPGYVYAVKAGDYVKIGVASNVQNRILGLRTGLPFELTIINTWKQSNATQAERALHRRFKSARCSGEWFQLSDADIDLLRTARRLDELIADHQK